MKEITLPLHNLIAGMLVAFTMGFFLMPVINAIKG